MQDLSIVSDHVQTAYERPDVEWERSSTQRPVEQTGTSSASASVSRKRPRAGTPGRPPWWLFVLASTAILIVSLTTFASPSGLSTSVQPPASTVGQLSLSSSGQLDPISSTGLNDMVTLTLHALIPPAAGTHYDVWLTPDVAHSSVQPLLLGALSVTRGEAHLTYVQPQHQNLLSTFAEIGLTADRDGIVAPVPTNPATWRYTGSIPATPTPGDEQHYSLLDHLRHLLAVDPTLQELGLSGGLGIWLDRNSSKLFEWSNAARDSWAGGQSTDLIHRHLLRILDYLDGSQYVWRDVPAGSPFLVDPLAGRIGLLTLDPAQNPSSYLSHIDVHLQGVIAAPGHTSEQMQLAQGIQQALKQVNILFQQMRQDARHLVMLSDAQLQQANALTLLNDMTTAAAMAYMGNDGTGGVAWSDQQMERLARIPVVAFAAGKSN